jgi:hypothetical protein
MDYVRTRVQKVTKECGEERERNGFTSAVGWGSRQQGGYVLVVHITVDRMICFSLWSDSFWLSFRGYSERKDEGFSLWCRRVQIIGGKKKKQAVWWKTEWRGQEEWVKMSRGMENLIAEVEAWAKTNPTDSTSKQCTANETDRTPQEFLWREQEEDKVMHATRSAYCQEDKSHHQAWLFMEIITRDDWLKKLRTLLKLLWWWSF